MNPSLPRVKRNLTRKSYLHNYDIVCRVCQDRIKELYKVIKQKRLITFLTSVNFFVHLSLITYPSAHLSTFSFIFAHLSLINLSLIKYNIRPLPNQLPSLQSIILLYGYIFLYSVALFLNNCLVFCFYLPPQ
jgi:hypothetical protein